jgi:Conjugative transposon protein TcpC
LRDRRLTALWNTALIDCHERSAPMPRAPRATESVHTLSQFQPPDPPPPPTRGRIPRLIGRLALWALIALAALRGFGPLPDRPRADSVATTAAPGRTEADHGSATDPGHASDQAATATATAFLREYLTIDGNHQAWAERLRRYLATGLDLDTSVSVPAGTSQYVDYVQPAGIHSTAGGAVQVTVLAHLLESRSGAYRDGGMLAFVVPLTAGGRGLTVSGLPRPAPVPITAGLTVRLPALPAAAARDVGVVARRAVVALLSRNHADLNALGGGTAPEVRELPDGWHATQPITVQTSGPPDEPTAQVLVQARPSTTGTRYVIPVLVSLRSGPDGIFVRRVDAGGRP